MNRFICFDDVLIAPEFSSIKSRAEVNTSTVVCGIEHKLPIISANMDSVTEFEMAAAMVHHGGVGCLHRFMTVDENEKQIRAAVDRVFFAGDVWGSIGLGNGELTRAEMLRRFTDTIVLDVAHGAQMEVVRQVKALRAMRGFEDMRIIVGNFATAQSINDFVHHLGLEKVDAFKVGIGGGSACTTRVVTGVGVPTLGSVLDCVSTGQPIIADGGFRTSGDVCKALVAGARAVMLGSMLAGTDESPGEIVDADGIEVGALRRNLPGARWHKRYRGSASAAAYQDQGKTAGHRTAEGESFLIPYKGSVASVLQSIEAGIRSCMAYVDASTLEELREARLVEVSPNCVRENGAHGNKK